mgnify:CR=1 FL=1
MKRSNKPRWKKTGGGALSLRDGRLVEPNQIFRADAQDIPQAFRDLVQPIDQGFGPSGSELEYEEPEPAKPSLEKAHRGGGRYVVYNTETNKLLTEEYLSKEEADTLIEAGGDVTALEGESDEGEGNDDE